MASRGQSCKVTTTFVVIQRCCLCHGVDSSTEGIKELKGNTPAVQHKVNDTELPLYSLLPHTYKRKKKKKPVSLQNDKAGNW